MPPFFEQDNLSLYCGNCRDVLATLPENSVDFVATDPPYGISFMEKDWDHEVPGPEYWRAVARVCKPGALLLAFGGTRTYHRLTCAIEDAGWEIRDCLMWLYGQGFPKAADIGKLIDKAKGAAARGRRRQAGPSRLSPARGQGERVLRRRQRPPCPRHRRSAASRADNGPGHCRGREMDAAGRRP